MTRFLLRSMAAAALVAGFTPTVMAAPNPLKKAADPLGRMKKVEMQGRWSSLDLGQGRKKVAPDHSFPQTAEFNTLEGPDGSTWYYTAEYDTETIVLEGGMATEDLVKGFCYTVYDSDFNLVGTVKDKIRFEEGEYKCARVMLDIHVTQKFFHYNDKYEVMVSLCMNAENYSVNIRTNVYSIGLEKDEEGYDIPVNVIAGHPIDAINTSPDVWGEKFYISFLTEKTPDENLDYPDLMDWLSEYYQVITTYSKAGMDNQPKLLHVQEIQQLRLPGDQMDTPYVLTKNVDGKFTMIFSQYEKSFYSNPAGSSEDESYTPDNNLLIDVYQLADNYAKELTHISRTTIAATPHTEDETIIYTYYGIGTCLMEKDVDFEHYSTDGTPAFIVSIDEYRTTNDDKYNSDYVVYDVNGNPIMTLAKNTENILEMSDIPGHEPQVMFVHTLDDFTFEFVDIYSGKSVVTLGQMYEGDALSATIDRVPTADGYLYAVAYGYGMDGGDDTVVAPVGWFNTDGELVRLDKINVGKGVQLAKVNIEKAALSPYVFNTDDDIEYMVLVKRDVEGSTALREEFIITPADKEPIETFLPDPERGSLGGIYLFDGSSPRLIISYFKNYRISADAYALPFTCFAGGDGTPANPYQIATAGDLAQIRKYPEASYKVVDDLDCSGVTFSPVHDFKGTIDGDGYNINNLSLYGTGNTGLIANSYDATFKNLTFNNAKISLQGDGDAGLLVANATNSKFDNIQIRRLTVDGERFGGAFGSIAGRLWRTCEMKGCGTAGADINLPNCPNAGGLTGEMRTGSSIEACSFIGNITAGNTLGGIVGTTTLGDETITNCHVDANLKAENTIGGIVGFSKRSAVEHCYAEGTIEATKANRWNNSYGLGGIVGELEGDWEGKANVPVKFNYVGISSITYPDTELTEMWPNQLSTVHRVVGRTSFNAEPEEKGTDADGKPIYKDEVKYEGGVLNNLVLDELACFDPAFDERSVEGESINRYDVGIDTLEDTLGFAYGSTIAAPWDSKGWFTYDPSLYFENMLMISESEKTVSKGSTFDIDICILSSDEIPVDDILGSFMCDFSDDLMEMTGEMNYADGVLSIEFKALEAGDAYFSASIMTGKASCFITITEDTPSGVNAAEIRKSVLSYRNGTVSAAGCTITLHAANGQLVKAGRDAIATSELAHGVYVATARDADGKTSTAKIIVK